MSPCPRPPMPCLPSIYLLNGLVVYITTHLFTSKPCGFVIHAMLKLSKMHGLRDSINLMEPKSQIVLIVAKTYCKHGIKLSLGMWGSKLLGLKRNYNSWKGTPNYMKTTFKQHVEISTASLMLKIQCGTKDHGTCGLPMAIEIPLFFFTKKLPTVSKEISSRVCVMRLGYGMRMITPWRKLY